jgi:hypothetical protein
MMIDLLPNLGNPMMKSIEISFHIVDGIGRGCNVSGVNFTVYPLLCWQVSDFSTKVCMLCFTPSHKKEHLIPFICFMKYIMSCYWKDTEFRE